MENPHHEEYFHYTVMLILVLSSIVFWEGDIFGNGRINKVFVVGLMGFYHIDSVIIIIRNS